MADRELLKRLYQELIDQGKIVEAGWVSYRLVVLSPAADKVQLEETRLAFFAGAQHLFGSIMTALDDDKEPTDNDLSRMNQIHEELQTFLAIFERKHGMGGKTQ